MKRITLLLSLGIVWLIGTPASAYELATHGILTEKAYERSMLVTDPQLLKSFGLDASNPNVFGEIYYDVFGTEVKERKQNDFEKSKMPNEGRDFLTIKGWLLRGAIREDDWTDIDRLGCHRQAPNPHDDNIDRPGNHFYDPVYDRGLTVFIVGERAPDWGLGTTNFQANPPPVNVARANHYTILDAREAMYRALTGRNRAGDVVADTQDKRHAYWATTFRALGDVVHLVEDMAQPQHTRNDPHLGCYTAVAGEESVFEKYIEARAIGQTLFTVGDKKVSFTLAGLTYGDPNNPYPVPRFTDYASFFTTRHKQADILQRQGMADYSNRGFFAAGKNLDASDTAEYAHPSNHAPSYGRVPVDKNWLDAPLGGSVTLLTNTVRDSVTGETATGVPLTTHGAWDQFLEERGLLPRYTLTRPNYDAQADLLIPRAVAYSAGLIDYFFRGRIEAEDAHFTETGISLRLRNTIDPDLKPEWRAESLYARTSSGNASTLTVAYEYRDEQNVTRYVTAKPIPLVTDPNNSANEDNIAPGEVSKHVYAFTIDVPFVDSAHPKIYQDLKYRLVYRGRLGNEDDAVVATTFRPVSGFLVTPNYVPADGIGGPRMIYKTSTGWRLTQDSGLVAGNIDWKGRYKADPSDPTGTTKPTKVLSWVGPKMRYFPDYERCYSAPFNRCRWVSSSDFSRAIFENGHVMANAPGNVLGAAITKDLNGKDWLVAICMMGTEDVVYRRPYRKGSDNLYDPVNAPNGWKEIGRFDASTLNQGASRMTHHADIPWFFSGDGRKAQTMRRWWETTSNDFLQKEMRLEINITDDIALAMPPQNHDNLGGYEGIYTCSTNYDQYGAGTGQSTSNSSGEYIIAVDYEDGNEILAKIRVTGNSTKTTTVSVAHNHQPDEGHSKDVVTGTTQTSGGPYKEDLLWKDGNVLSIFSDGRSENISWSTGPEPSNNSYNRTIDRTSHEKEISYLVDLRYNLYSYYFVNTHSREDISGGVINYAENTDEGNEMTSDLMSSKISLYSNAWPPYASNTSPYRIEKELNCGFIPSPFITRRYGLSNFGWFLQSPGSGMIDVQGNYAISHPSAADFGYETLAPTNLLTNGRLEDVIKNAPTNAYYYPISVLY